MKKLTKLFMGLIIAVMFVACDNNDGPFSTKMINGKKVVYSGNKPAKGWINSTRRLYDGTTVVLFETYVENGIMVSGDFNMYDVNGNLTLAGTGKLVNEDDWEGTVIEYFSDGEVKGTYKGTFSHSSMMSKIENVLNDEYAATYHFTAWPPLRNGYAKRKENGTFYEYDVVNFNLNYRY